MFDMLVTIVYLGNMFLQVKGTYRAPLYFAIALNVFPFERERRSATSTPLCSSAAMYEKPLPCLVRGRAGFSRITRGNRMDVVERVGGNRAIRP